MILVLIFLMVIISAYVVISHLNDKRKEARGICKTTGGTCTSPRGCTCGEDIERPKDSHSDHIGRSW